MSLLNNASINVPVPANEPNLTYAPGTPERTKLKTALEELKTLQSAFESLAESRSQELLADHRRIREATDARGEYQVKPQLPIDVMGVYVLVPDTALF